MTEIDVPDWVVEVAGEAFGRHNDLCWDDGSMRAALTAALGAWVARTGFTNSEEMRELLAGRGGWVSGIELDGDTRTLYTLRQEKPE